MSIYQRLYEIVLIQRGFRVETQPQLKKYQVQSIFKDKHNEALISHCFAFAHDITERFFISRVEKAYYSW